MDALILVDLQNDFLPGGAMAVPDGDAVIPVANRVQSQFELIVATQDWHPADHGSFAVNYEGRSPGDIIELNGLNQILWPVHCVQHTFGAKLSGNLDTRRIEKIVQKGTDTRIDSYSGFFNNGRTTSTGLDRFLRKRKVTHLYIMGLATDYCVKYTALDARSLEFDTYLITDGCRGVGLQSGDIDAAQDKMKCAGVKFVLSDDLLQ